MRRVLRCVVPFVLAVLVTACGVRPTGVIGAGEPAVAQQAVPQTTVYLARGERLVPVRRVAFPGAPQAALYDLLSRGATSTEIAAGMRNPLNDVSLLDITFRQDLLVVDYYADMPLSRLVKAQIVCSGTAQPDIHRVQLVGWVYKGPGNTVFDGDSRHPPQGWVAFVDRERKCSQYANLLAS
ncbi:hypothetical protein GCM10023196_007730 [Actinoallomurus vinaceus]|uniref:Lipoprotein n=1 Tax=Actinoallomurus vinaceus TaxID=1080074 RepID=A0ABP8U0L7_9ACTN